MILKLIPIIIINICYAKARTYWHSNIRRYENYTLYRGIPFVNRQLRFLINLEKYCDVIYWREPSVLRMPVDFVIAPKDKLMFEERANDIGLRFLELIPDVQKAINLQTVKPYSRRLKDTFNWNNYYTLEDIYYWMKDLANMHATEVNIVRLGKTLDDRNILAMKIILKDSIRRSRVMIEGGIHGRDWISPAFVTYMIDQILNSAKSENKMLKEIGRTYEWLFVPVLNPDGYHYTHKVDRFWKKNCNGSGVNLNRNFESVFGRWSRKDELAAVSSAPFSSNYIGDRAFSEPESRALGKFVEENRSGMEYYLSFHSYNKRIIIPYEHTQQNLDNYDEVYDLAKAAAQAMKSVTNNYFTVGNHFELYGECVSGTSTSWAKDTFKIPYAVTIELEDPNFGFLLPPHLISPTCKEVFAGVLKLLEPKNNTFTTIAPVTRMEIISKSKKKGSKKKTVKLVHKSSDGNVCDSFITVMFCMCFSLHYCA